MQLYFSGESFRNTQNALRLLGVEVSHVAILKWIRKHVALIDRYLERLTPQVSDTWREDEVYVKFRGSRKYLFAVMALVRLRDNGPLGSSVVQFGT